MLPDAFDLILIAYYLQRDLFAKVKAVVWPGGVVVAIANSPDAGEHWSDEQRLGSCAGSSVAGTFYGTMKGRRATRHIVDRLPRLWRGDWARENTNEPCLFNRR
jgi:hypothetical protein